MIKFNFLEPFKIQSGLDFTNPARLFYLENQEKTVNSLSELYTSSKQCGALIKKEMYTENCTDNFA